MHENNRLQRKKRVQKLKCKRKVKKGNLKIRKRLMLKKKGRRKNNGKLVNPVSLRCRTIVIEIIVGPYIVVLIFLY